MSGRPSYPWSEGDALYADELNAAIANSVANAGGPFLPLSGGPTGASTQIAVSGNDYHGFAVVYGRSRWYGQITGPDGNADNSIAANKFLWDDNADISGGNGTAAALYAQTVVQGDYAPTNTASRQAIHSHLAVAGRVGVIPTLGPLITGVDFVSQLSTAYAVASQGGLGGWTLGNNPATGYFRGALFGGNDNAWLDTGASNYWNLIGREIDVGIYNAANVYQRIGLLMVGVNSARQADGDDCGIAFVGGTNGHKNAIQFGTTTSDMILTDSLIKIVNRVYPSPHTPAFVTGLDFTAATFSGNALATPGFAVDGNGRVAANRVWGDLTGAMQWIGLGDTADYSKSWLYGSTYWYGGPVTHGDPASGGQISANALLFTDTAAITSLGGAHALFLRYGFGGDTTAENTAGRDTLFTMMAVNGQMGPTPILGVEATAANFVAHTVNTYSAVSQGGLGGWTAGSNPGLGYFRGSLFGGVDVAWLGDAASNYWMIVGREIDVQIAGAASVYQRIGVLESCFVSSKQAAGDDCGFMFVVQHADGNNHKNGIQFGASTTPFAVTDSLIKAVPVLYPTPATPTYNNGIDFASVIFSGNALATPGFRVDGNGRVTAHLDNAANDAAAATAGTGLGQLYRNGGIIQVRLA